MLFIVFDERHDMDIVLSTEDPDVVVHPDAASVHVQNRWIGGKKEYLHYSGASDDTTERTSVLGHAASTARYLSCPFRAGSENPVVALMALNAPVLPWPMHGLDSFLERDRDRELFGLAPKPPPPTGGFRMMTNSDRRPRIPVATTPAEFNECFASGEAFEASEELAAQMGFYPVVEDVLSDEEFFAPPRTERGGLDEC